MNILGIETSCDETAVSIVSKIGGAKNPSFEIRANVVLSQVDIHREYGGVFPSLAKREHSKNLLSVMLQALRDGKMLKKIKAKKFNKVEEKKLQKLLEREPELLKEFLSVLPTLKKPDIDHIAVTAGPGLEPALWVGINFARALSFAWKIPVIPVNHMEGHFFSAFITGKKFDMKKLQFPVLALLVSGGHTELVYSKKLLSYEKIGETVDDAVGEAFDKVARMLDLPYPGGPEVSRIAELGTPGVFHLPRPMINSKDYNFSFAGLKTAVLYTLAKEKNIAEEVKQNIAREFEEASTEVLVKKTIDAAEQYKIKTLLLGGGVAANKRLRDTLTKKSIDILGFSPLLPNLDATGDNAGMIAVAGAMNAHKKFPKIFPAQGNLSF